MKKTTFLLIFFFIMYPKVIFGMNNYGQEALKLQNELATKNMMGSLKNVINETNVNTLLPYGYPLHYVQYVPVAKYFLECGANPNLVDDHHLTPLAREVNCFIFEKNYFTYRKIQLLLQYTDIYIKGNFKNPHTLKYDLNATIGQFLIWCIKNLDQTNPEERIFKSNTQELLKLFAFYDPAVIHCCLQKKLMTRDELLNRIDIKFTNIYDQNVFSKQIKDAWENPDKEQLETLLAAYPELKTWASQVNQLSPDTKNNPSISTLLAAREIGLVGGFKFKK